MRGATPSGPSSSDHKDEFVAAPVGLASHPLGVDRPERRRRRRRARRQWFADAARAAGFPTVEIWPASDGAPAVFAEWPSDDPNAPTVLVYGHHDVQPVDPDRVVELRAVRAGRRTRAGRRPVARSRSVRRQGHGAVPPARVAGEPCGERAHQPAGEPEVAHRGRGGVRLTGVPRPASREARSA